LPREQWILFKDVHAGYISWEQYEKNLQRLQENANANGQDREESPARGARVVTRLGCLWGLWQPDDGSLPYAADQDRAGVCLPARRSRPHRVGMPACLG
jgi:hypothetical protein